jgi:methyl-accepting chemotaxis protein
MAGAPTVKLPSRTSICPLQAAAGRTSKETFVKLTLSKKLYGGFAAVGLTFLAALVAALVLNAHAEDQWKKADDANAATAGAALQIRGIQEQMVAQSMLVATFDKKYEDAFNKGVELGTKGTKVVGETGDATVKKISAGAEAADQKHDAAVNDHLFPAVAAGDHAAAEKALLEADTNVRVGYDAALKIEDHNAKIAEELKQGALSGSATAKQVAIIAALLAALLAAGVGYFIARGIKRGVAEVLDRIQLLGGKSVAELENGLTAMAEGDLTVSVDADVPAVEYTSSDEIGQVATAVNDIRARILRSVEAYNAMVEKLGNLIGNVSGSASSVSSASQQMASTSEEAGRAVGEIANAVGDVAQGAERQVRQVDSVKSSADEAATAARTSAEQAAEAAEVAEQAREYAREGVGAAEQATEAMQSVRDSSESVTEAIRALASKSEAIGAIVETITGIAGQTNLLALNAAIEAARAGEQGRGFAVVAEEVRKLAEESQQAAEEISGLIAQIQGETHQVVGVVEDGAERTAQGAETVEQTREAFVRIGEAVEDVNTRIAQIAGAAHQISAETSKMQGEIAEVAAVAEQSSASTEEVSASTEQTSASTQEIAASAQELASTAGELEALVATFKVS